ncbi:MAG TPA: pyridoxal phosphate-dependent aminotransferase [Pseudogracilibacillus sp.]|nr:pyridoxal phosphate-dependent aminotransferase [Pseudogracilibacillus sp.]
MELSRRVKALTPSSTLAISAKAKEYNRKGYDVIGLGVGEPDFNTPDYITTAGKKAMDEGHTKYTASGGIPELKEAVTEKFQHDNNLSYTTDEVIITAGAKFAFYELFQVLLDEGDEVIIPTPYWVSYPEHVKLAGGSPVFVEGMEENDFKITKEQLNKVITKQTKAIIINSPSNPTGMMYSEQELRELGEICLQHDILILSDEIYEKLIYVEEPHVSIASLSSELKNQTVVINGVSKSHAMTGWRIGYAAGPKEIIQAMTAHASQTTSNPSSISQYAAIEAYTNETFNRATEHEMKKVFSERLDLFYDLITAIPGITCNKPHGAFYIFPNVKTAVEKGGFSTVDEWVEALLEEEKVALVPGSGFGAPNNVRLSYATSVQDLEKAAERITRFVENHS